MNPLTTAPRAAPVPLSLTAPIADDLQQVERLLAESLVSRQSRVAEVIEHVKHYRGNLALSEQDYYEIIEGKTAELIACCCQLGALYAGADETVIEALTNYGRQIGIAFQIADDVLDLVGVEETTGKSLGTDLEQQKLTLPLIHLLAQANGAAAKVRQVLTSPGNHKREALVPLLTQTGAVEVARRKAQEFAA